ncbi:uncharacterized protein V1510DRAFT_418930 [Dipodascopsis tothii]|uniref:uncharacterized protein n=1 Tax=Dipodascopsis tothii TaxID=44089 RepID=UPI0034CD1693
MDPDDLYAVLGVGRTATASEIKKAYHKAALASHPDKVPEDQREAAEVQFKIVSRAYEILSDDDKRRDYDELGMDAFEPGKARGPGFSEDDFYDFFGGPDPRSYARRDPARTDDARQDMDVPLAAMYTGREQKVSITRDAVCGSCKGSGARPGVVPRKCSKCKGSRVQEVFKPVGDGYGVPVLVKCSLCDGRGTLIKEKDRCRKCKGHQVSPEKKVLSFRIPPGAADGDRITLEGAADEEPGKAPGDVVFTLREQAHPVFARKGADLRATLDVTLVEALAGFSRTVLKHLDGRGLRFTLPPGRVLRPGDVVLVKGEGMPVKNGGGMHNRGDLYLDVRIEFPKDGWCLEAAELRRLENMIPFLPRADEPADVVDDVDYETVADDSRYGSNVNTDPEPDSDDDAPRGGCAQM